MRFTSCLLAGWLLWPALASAQRARPLAVTASAIREGAGVVAVLADSLPRHRTRGIVVGAVIGAAALATMAATYEAGQCERPSCGRPIKGAVGGAVVGGALGALLGWLFQLPHGSPGDKPHDQRTRP